MGLRTITAGFLSALTAKVVRPCYAVDMAFDSGTTRVNQSPSTITIEGNPYLGVGKLGRIGMIQENTDSQASRLALQLSGIRPEDIEIALNEPYQGRKCRVWYCLLDEGHQVIPNPKEVFRGRIDTMDILLGETAEITVSVESRWVDWETAGIMRYTMEDQKKRSPDDRGLEFIPLMPDMQIVWGSQHQQANPVSAGGGGGGGKK